MSKIGECALKFIAAGTITIEMVQKAKGRCWCCPSKSIRLWASIKPVDRFQWSHLGFSVGLCEINQETDCLLIDNYHSCQEVYDTPCTIDHHHNWDWLRGGGGKFFFLFFFLSFLFFYSFFPFPFSRLVDLCGRGGNFFPSFTTQLWWWSGAGCLSYYFWQSENVKSRGSQFLVDFT